MTETGLDVVLVLLLIGIAVCIFIDRSGFREEPEAEGDD